MHDIDFSLPSVCRSRDIENIRCNICTSMIKYYGKNERNVVLTSMRAKSSLVILPTNSLRAKTNSEITVKKILVAASIKVGSSSIS